MCHLNEVMTIKRVMVSLRAGRAIACLTPFRSAYSWGEPQRRLMTRMNPLTS